VLSFTNAQIAVRMPRDRTAHVTAAEELCLDEYSVKSHTAAHINPEHQWQLLCNPVDIPTPFPGQQQCCTPKWPGHVRTVNAPNNNCHLVANQQFPYY
jgi:hypothetical protein